MGNDTLNQEALSQAHVAIAVLETKVESQGREIGELKALIREMSGKLDGVVNTLSEARGGWKFMMLLGGGAATFGSVLTWVATHMTGKGAP